MRRQLVWLSAATTSLVVVAFLLPLAFLVRTLAEDRAVAAALQEGQSLAVLTAVSPPSDLAAAVTLLDERSPRQLTILLPGGRTLGAPLPSGSRTQALAGSGRSFTADVEGGREVFVPVDLGSGRAVVRSFVPTSLLHRGVVPAVAVLCALGLGLLVVAVLVADRLARGTVRPVEELARTTHALAGGELSSRAEPAGPPEVREVARAVNSLGRRIGELLVAEREAVADLSHRLRTPLTALRLDSEGLRNPEEAARLGAGVAAVERTVDQVIREARRPVREGVNASCDAGAVAGERVAFWSVLAEDQNRAFGVQVPTSPLPVRTSPEDLAAALDVLLENVFTHTPDGTEATVVVRRTTTGVEVEVADRGPGMPAQALERGHSSGGSTGLGLDIARRTAEASGGRLRVAARPAGGSVVTMELGTP
ncbi:MAG: two-component sensor histidine kinase [Frankiales bacterium]|nr:two-component sensor histidine kinase [Frankiales bacterium]